MQFRQRTPIDQKDYALYELGTFCYEISKKTELGAKLTKDAVAMSRLARLAISVLADGTHLTDDEMQSKIEGFEASRDLNKIGQLRRA